MPVIWLKSQARAVIGVGIVFFVLSLAVAPAGAQELVDATVATLNDGSRTQLITYTDLLWQLALEPGVPIDPPRPSDLSQALQTQIDQRLFALEAERLPRSAPSPEEVAAEIKATLESFASAPEFESRLKRVGFTSVNDENFERIIAQRVLIKKYIDFRFRSFVVVTADEEAKYYTDVFVPDFRRRYSGVVLPTIDEKRAEIHRTLIENKVAERIETFLDQAKRRVEIVRLMEF